jgi:hypothetical protein
MTVAAGFERAASTIFRNTDEAEKRHRIVVFAAGPAQVRFCF